MRSRARSQRLSHQAVRDARIQKLVTLRSVSKSLVERDGLDLGRVVRVWRETAAFIPIRACPRLEKPPSARRTEKSP